MNNVTIPAASGAKPIMEALATALGQQPAFVRKKDSLAGAAATVIQVVNLLTLMGQDWNPWIHVAIAVVAGLAQVVLSAATPGAFTESMQGRLVDAWIRSQVMKQSEQADAGAPVAVPAAEASLPSYDLPSTAELVEAARNAWGSSAGWLGTVMRGR